ncbi:hypothetical protein COC42_07090 [Sphingomonas spermidinifaciens]|uniref:Integrase catalytic domain-containing protein n=1 Tax=Sphingomonas spermidinifaciens TaxID=1141889 RepID=A0A2A4B8V5_9SPHN|nr:hypothetical protein COC42_07090 [Sphingomonas spermidinifaciens]
MVTTSIDGRRVVPERTGPVVERGRPGMFVSDNAGELTPYAVLSWSGEAKVEWHYIVPGRPMNTATSRAWTGACAVSC